MEKLEAGLAMGCAARAEAGEVGVERAGGEDLVATVCRAVAVLAVVGAVAAEVKATVAARATGAV